MRRGVSYYATAPCLVPPALPVPVFWRVAWHHMQLVRQPLILAIIISLLTLSPLTASASSANPGAASAGPAMTAPGQAAQRASQPYAAWSCRGVYHVVRRGETLYSIARRYGTTAYRIAVCNGLASYTVYVGQTLLVPMGR